MGVQLLHISLFNVKVFDWHAVCSMECKKEALGEAVGLVSCGVFGVKMYTWLHYIPADIAPGFALEYAAFGVGLISI